MDANFQYKKREIAKATKDSETLKRYSDLLKFIASSSGSLIALLFAANKAGLIVNKLGYSFEISVLLLAVVMSLSIYLIAAVAKNGVSVKMANFIIFIACLESSVAFTAVLSAL